MSTLKKEVAFIDANVADLDQLIAGLRSEVEPIVLVAGQSAPQQMAHALEGLTDLTAVHIVAHGRPGEVQFSGGALSLETLEQHADELFALGLALADDGVVQLYSCNVAEGQPGRHFVKQLADRIGAHVFASAGKVGAESLGGHWNLISSQAHPGVNVRMPIMPETATEYRHTLAITVGLAPASDTGSSNSDGITKNTTATITGTGGTYGNVVVVNVGGTDYNAAVGPTGAYSVVVSLAAGSNGISAQEYNGVNPVGSPATTSVILDTTVPYAPGAPDVQPSSDTGTSSTDDLSNDDTPTARVSLAGTTAVAGDLVTLKSAGVAVGSVTLTATDISNGYADVTASTALGADGSKTLTATVTDLAGNESGLSTSLTYQLDKTAPTTTISGIDISNDSGSSASDFTTNVASQTVTATLNTALGSGEILYGSVDGGTSWTDLAAFVSGTAITWTGVTLAGTSSIQMKVTDAAGNHGMVASQSYILDNAAPSIAIAATLEGDNIVNAAEDDTVTVSGTTSGVENGQTVSVALSDGFTTVTTTATVSAGAWTAADADISALTNGPITVTADVSDAAGNPATQASASLTLDNAAPSIAIAATLEGDNIVNAAEDDTVTVSGTTSGVENGQTVSVALSDGVTTVTTTATVSAGAWTAADADISALTNGPITVTADVSDDAGNPAAQASASLTLDNAAPSIAIAATLEGDNIVNAAEDGTVTVSGTTSGVENGQTVSVALSDGFTTVTTTATVSAGAWTAADADISALTNGPITVTADVSDAAGNPATQASASLTLDNAAPSIAIAATLEGDNIVNAAEDDTVTVSGTTSGVENGQTVSVALSDGFTTVTTTATVSAGAWTAADADISALTNGPITVTADVSDAAGNPATQASASLTLDNAAPSIAIAATLEGDNIVNAAEDDTVTVSGTTSGVENGQTVSVALSDGFTTVTTTATVSAGAWTAADADISALTNGPITVTADVSDAAGNPATQASASLTLDNAAPSIAIAATLEGDNIVNAAEDDTVTVSGTTSGVENGQTVSVALSDGVTTVTTTATVSAGAWTAADADISALTNGPITVTADVSDDAGNPAAQASASLTLDNAAPSIAIAATLEGDNIVNAAEDGTVTVSGTTSGVENGQTVSVALSDGFTTVTTTATVSAGAWTAADADISALTNGPITVTADVSDAAGNPATQASASLTLDNAAPSIAIAATLEGDNIVNAAEDDTVTVSGTTSGVENGQTVSVALSDGFTTVTTTATVSAGAWTAADADISALTNGPITVTADVSDAAGDPATQASASLTLDNAAPSIAIAATLEGDNIVNAAEDDTVTVSGTTSGVENGQTVSVALSDGFTTVTTTATVSAGAWTAADADISALTNGPITVTADVSDAAGNPATQASASLTLDNAAPSIAIAATLEGDNIVNAAEDDTVTVSGTTSGVENGQTVSVALSDGFTTVTTTATVSAGAWTAADADISALTNGPITVTADVSDAAGNPATQASASLTLDNAAPSIAIAATLEGDNIVNAAEDDTVTVSGTTSGVENGQTVSVALSDGFTTVTTTATVSAGAWTAADADISALTNGPITVTADVSDAAGNPATQASASLTLDNAAPSIAIAATLEGDNIVNAAEDDTVTVSGTTSGVENGQTVSVALSDGFTTVTTTATVSAGAWTAADADISALTNGPITVTADVSDAAGNPATQASASLTLDNVADALPSTTLVVGGGSGPNVAKGTVSFVVSGLDGDATGQVTFTDGTTSTEPVAVSGNATYTANLSALTGTITSVLSITDAAGNTASVNGNTVYTTIQAAVNAASNDDTITIGTGTYTEQVVIDGKDGLTLQEDTGADVTIAAPTTLVSTGNSPTGSVRAINGIVTVKNASDVIIQGVTVDGLHLGGSVTGIPNPTMAGITYIDASGIIDGVEVNGIREPDAQFGNQRGLGIYITNSDPSPGGATTPSTGDTLKSIEIKNSTVKDFQKGGIAVSYADVYIHGNTITGKGGTDLTAQNGIQVSGSTGSIEGNTVTAIGYTGANWSAAGILTYYNNELLIDGNTVTGSGSSDLVLGIATLNSVGGEVTNNTISNVGWGIDAEDYAPYGWADALIPGAAPYDYSTNTLSGIGENGLWFQPDAASTDAFNVTGTDGDDVIYGASAGDTLAGGDGNDQIDGGADADSMSGGAGDDNYTVDNTGDAVVEAAGEGTDTLTTSVSYTLAAGSEVESLVLADLATDTEDFEDFTAGPITDGENGWRFVGGAKDQEVMVDPNNASNLVFRMSSDPSVTDFSGPYSPSLPIAAGEPGTTAAADSQAISFDFRAVQVNDSSRMEVDLGNVAGTDRNNFLVIENRSGDGIRIAVADPLLDGNWDTGDDTNNFAAFTGNRTLVSGVDSSVGHTLSMVVRYLAGADNDVIDVYLDGAHVGSTTTFENYRDALGGTHAANAEANQTSRLFFRGSAGGAPQDGAGGQNQGFLFDNIQNAIFESGQSLTGNEFAQSLTGNAGDNTLTGNGGNDTIDGGLGTDTAQYAGPRSDYTVGTTMSGGFVTGFTSVTDDVPSGGDEGTDTLSSVEVLSFADGDLELADPIQLFDALGDLIGTFDAIDAAVAAAVDGQKILIADGTYTLSSTLNVDKSLTIIGESETGVVINAGSSGYGILVTADDSSLSNFTLVGTASNTYGLKASPDGVGGPGSRLNDLNIENVTVRGFGGSEVDLNGVLNATLSEVTADGDGTAGVGIAISDSAHITLTDVTTTDNLWGSVGLYSTNVYYDQQTHNIVFSGSYTHNESVGIYADDASATTDLGSVTFPSDFPSSGASAWKVTNDAFRGGLGDSENFTFFFATEAEALAFALAIQQAANVGADNTRSVVEDPDGKLVVETGLTIQAAVDAADGGDTILVGAGTFSEDVTLSDGLAVTIQGEGDTATVIAGQITSSGDLNGMLKLQDLGIDATGNQYGVFASNSSTGYAGSIVLNNVAIDNATQDGFAYIRAGNGAIPSLTDTVGNIQILNSDFDNNGTATSGSDGRGDVLLFGYNQALTINGSSFHGNYASSLIGTQKAIQLRGVEDGGDTVNAGPYDAAGAVSLNDLTITGNYAQDAIAIYRIASFSSFALTDVSASVSAPWGVFNADEVGGTLDLSGLTGTNTGGAGVLATPQGLATANTFTGTTGADKFTGRGGNDALDGGDGNDTVVLTGNRTDYTITLSSSTYTVVDNRGGAPDGTDSVTNVENFQFADGTLTAGGTLDIVGPTVTSVAYGMHDGTLKEGQSVDLVVTFSEAVILAGGSPTLTLNTGGTATYASSSASSLTFSYTVAASENTADLTVTAFNLNGATIKDVQGNDANPSGAVADPFGTLVVDTVAPTAVTTAVADMATDSGTSGDFITNDPLVAVSGSFSGTLGSGETIQVSADGTNWVTTGTLGPVDSIWASAADAVALVPGAGILQTRTMDAAGNITLGATQAYTLDTGADPLSISLVVDTGASAIDWETSNGMVAVSGLEGGASWQFSTDAGSNWTPGSGSSFTLGEGPYDAGDIVVEQTDLAGNTSSVASATAIVVDSAPPVAPVFGLDNDTGSNPADGITNDGDMTVTGMEAGGWKLEYSTNGGGAWTEMIGSTFTLSAGTYATGSIQVRQTDVAGNVGAPASNPAEITVDLVAVDPSFALVADTGSSSSDGVTSNGQIQVSGLEAGGSWQYSTNNGSSWTAGSGSSFTLAEGSYAASVIKVRQTDLAGNLSNTVSGAAITVDSVAPAAQTTSISQIVNDTGTLGDFITSDGIVDVSGQYTGTLLAGETLQVSANGGSTWLDATTSSPYWGASGLALIPGSGTLTTRTIDTAGNVTPGASHSYVYSTLPLFTGTPNADTLTGTNADEQFLGLGNNDTIYALGGNDIIDGGSGADAMEGGAGNDTYYYSGTGDLITENSDEGIDLVIAAATYTLGANVENLTLGGFLPKDGYGNNLNNVLTGNSAKNILFGYNGNDTLYGLDGNDTLDGGKNNDSLFGGSGDDSLAGQSGSDYLEGGAGNDTLNGHSEADTMVGGDGDDTYYYGGTGDVIVENSDEGIDLVIAKATYTLGANQENLTLIGTSAINGYGNSPHNNVLTGNSAGNILYGYNGNDTLYGLDGNDTLDGGKDNDSLFGGNGNDTLAGQDGADYLEGGQGNDTLNGHAGADTMVGGDGNDTYYYSGTGDVITEDSDEGIDLVIAAATYTLGANLENLTLSGTGSNQAHGNSLDNILTGNNGSNQLFGYGGNDALYGGLGNDTLTGGDDADQFVFNTALGPTNKDTIADFVHGTDLVVLENAVFAAFAATGTPNATSFDSGSGRTAADDALDRLVYNTDNGNLYYDSDGVGGAAAVQIATLTGLPTLSHDDFLIV